MKKISSITIKPRRHKITVPIYTGNFYVFVFDSKKSMHEMFPNHKKDNAWCYKDSDYSYVMVLAKDSLLSTIVHESVHIVNYIFEFHGVKLDPKNDEHQAYFTTWVFEQCEKFINKSFN